MLILTPITDMEYERFMKLPRVKAENYEYMMRFYWSETVYEGYFAEEWYND